MKHGKAVPICGNCWLSFWEHVLIALGHPNTDGYIAPVYPQCDEASRCRECSMKCDYDFRTKGDQ